jgi:hypothetical protein
MTTSQEAREYPPFDWRAILKRAREGVNAGSRSISDMTTEQGIALPLLDHLSEQFEIAERSYVDADRKARQQEALDARRYRSKRDIDERRFKETGTYMQAGPLQETMLAGWRASYDASIDAAIAKGERHDR